MSRRTKSSTNFIAKNKNFNRLQAIEAERNTHMVRRSQAFKNKSKVISLEEREVIDEILSFWFPPIGWDRHTSPSKEAVELHWAPNPNVDRFIRENYQFVMNHIERGELEHWIKDRDGVLAYIVCADMFSRRLYAGTPRAYTLDDHAVIAAKTLMGKLNLYRHAEKALIMSPLLHSENENDIIMAIDELDVLEKQSKAEKNNAMHENFKLVKGFAQQALIPIEAFGRYPQRNKILGRKTTHEEEKYL